MTWGHLRRDRSPSAFRDAAGERGAEEADGGHGHHPEVPEEDELVADGKREEGAREGGAEGAREALCATRNVRVWKGEVEPASGCMRTIANWVIPLVTPRDAASGAASLTRIMLTL